MGRGASSGQGSLLASGLFITWALLPRRVAEWILAVCHSGASPVSPKRMTGEGLKVPASLSPEIWPSADLAPLPLLDGQPTLWGLFLKPEPWLFALGNVPRVPAWACDFLRAEMSLLGSLRLGIPCTSDPVQVPGSQPVASW